MNRVYRILRQAYAKHPFDGEGAYRYGGRWSPKGTRLAYTAATLSLAMIEYFVHLDENLTPPELVFAIADVPKTISRHVLSVAELPADWKRFPAPSELTVIGARFVQEGKLVSLMVPSAIVPGEFNWLLNPAHRDFARIAPHAPERFECDSRFFK